MVSITVALLVCALVCFVLAAGNVPSRVNLVGLGLAFWVLTLLLGRI